MVSALPKDGIPTMRSALPTRLTSARPSVSSAEGLAAAGFEVRTSLLGRASADESSGASMVARRSVSTGPGGRSVADAANPIAGADEPADEAARRIGAKRELEPVVVTLAGEIARVHVL